MSPAGERGEGIVAALLLLAGALLPLMFLVALIARVEQAKLAAEQAAQTSVRAAVLAPTLAQAQLAAQAELLAAQASSPAPLSLELTGSFARGGVLEAQVRTEVPVSDIPLWGAVGAIALEATARAPVDLYRSFPGSS